MDWLTEHYAVQAGLVEDEPVQEITPAAFLKTVWSKKGFKNLETVLDTSQEDGRLFLQRTYIVAKRGYTLAVFATKKVKMVLVLRELRKIQVSGYPGFYIACAVPSGGFVESHDKYDTMYVRKYYPQELQKGERKVVAPSPATLKAALNNLRKNYPGLYEELAKHIG